MNLDFSDDQKLLQDEARKFLSKEQALLRNRTVLEKNNKVDKDLWEKIVALGWTGIRIPEEYNGLDLGHLELCVIAEELGRFLAPVPFSSSVYLFTEAIINYADDEIKSHFLPKLVSGDVIGTLAVTEDLFAPSKDNIKLSLKTQIDAIGVGSFFVFYGKLNAVLISYPNKEIKKIINNEK